MTFKRMGIVSSVEYRYTSQEHVSGTAVVAILEDGERVSFRLVGDEVRALKDALRVGAPVPITITLGPIDAVREG